MKKFATTAALMLALSAPAASAQKVIAEDEDTFTVVAGTSSLGWSNPFGNISARVERQIQDEKQRSLSALQFAARYGEAKGCMFLAQFDKQWTERERRLMWEKGTYNTSGHILRLESGRVFTTRDSVEDRIYDFDLNAAVFVCMRSKPEGNLDARRYATPQELLALR